MKDTSIYLIVILLALSCNQDENTSLEESSFSTCSFNITNCSIEQLMPDLSKLHPVDTMGCQIRSEHRELTSDSKFHMWPYCEDVNQLIYEDSLGNRIELDIRNREHKKENSILYYSGEECTHVINEIMTFSLNNENMGIELVVELSPGGSTPDIYDGLRISKIERMGVDSKIYHTVLFMFLNNRNPRRNLFRYSYSRIKRIAEKDYNDVYFNHGKYQFPMEIYYNKECGLIAFRDDMGTLWSLIDLI